MGSSDPNSAPPIRSRRNPTVQALRRLAVSAEARDREVAYLADGVRLVEEAVRSSAPIDLALASPRLRREERGRELEAALARAAARLLPATDEVVGAVVGVPRHQGVVARLRRQVFDLDEVLERHHSGSLVVACGVQDPGNLGAILRVAAAAGAAAVLATEGCADPWNPKAVRASAGALFRLPVVKGLAPAPLLERLGRAGYRRLAAAARGGIPYRDADWGGAVALLLGGEAAGLPADLLERCDAMVTIPMAAGIESLNVLAAATLLLYEAAQARSAGGRETR